MKSSWRCVIVLFSILAAPLYGHAVTLQDLTIPGASFTASPATYTDFQILFSRTFGTTPLSLADVNITPFGAGFVLSPSFSAIGKAEDIDLHMHFTVHSASITGFGVGGTVIAGGGGGGTLFARDDIGDTAGGSVSTTEFQQATFFPISQFDVIAPTSILHVDFFVGADNLPCSVSLPCQRVTQLGS